MKTILITGATDGIGLETARKLHSLGHTILLHGRSEDKLNRIGKELGAETFRADLSDLTDVERMSKEVLSKYSHLDVLINNAGVYKTSEPITKEGYDIRFVVNTFAPYLLTKMLLPLLNGGSVINLSSAAQRTVNFEAMMGKIKMEDFEAYAQSKLAITMWSRYMANELGEDGPIIISVNPGSFLGTKMVREGFGTSGNDINIGVNILTELSLDEKHSESSGKYYDNDSERFASPAADGLDEIKTNELISQIEKILNKARDKKNL